MYLAISFAAAARAALVVPGFFDAEAKLEKRFGAGFGVTRLAFGRGAAVALIEAVLVSEPATPSRLDARAGVLDTLDDTVGFVVVGTTDRFVAGRPLLSVSRGRFNPTTGSGLRFITTCGNDFLG